MEYIERIKTLANAGALPHAIIFEGDESRYFASMFFAKCVVCESEIKPCDECNHCKKADKKIHPDIIELFPSGKMMDYSIKEIRRIKEDAFVLPNEARAKVYIFNDVDNISVLSQNAFLKILEEPPKSVVFVLNCKTKTHLLDTIISRATYILTGEKENNEDVDITEALELLKTAVFESELELLKKITNTCEEKQSRLKMVTALQTALRELYLIKCGTKTQQNLEDLVEKLTVNKILQAIELTENLRVSTHKNKSVKLMLSSFCAKFKSLLGR